MKFSVFICMLMINNSFAVDESMKKFEDMSAPFAPKKEHSYKIHDQEIQDPYAWIRDANWKSAQDTNLDPQILNYIKEENTYRDAFFAPLESTVDQLFKERKGFIAPCDESVPVKKDDYYYYSRQKNDENYRTYFRKKGSLEAQEEVIMDVNQESLAHKFFNIGTRSVSPCHNLMIYTVDTEGSEFFKLYIRDLNTKKELIDTIPNVASVVWLPDSSGFYYVPYNESWRTKQVYFHKLGTQAEQDTLIHEETKDVPSLGIEQSFDDKYLFVSSETKEDSEIYYIDLTSPERKLEKLIDRVSKRSVSPEHKDGYFYLLMNDTGSNFRLVKRPVNGQEMTEVIPHNPKVYLRAVVPYAQGLVVPTRENGLNRLAIYQGDSTTPRYVSMADPVYSLGLIPTTYDDPEIRYTYSSFSKPETVFATTFDGQETRTLKVEEVPSGFEVDQMVTERIWAKSRDGETEVPISLVYRKDKFKKGEDNPVLLYGYGSYGYGIIPGFNRRALSYVNQGFIYAVAHIRGGDELGYQWYLDGKFLEKKNTFNDFIDSAEALVRQGYTTQGMVAAMGGSAGGMLMGVIANERPELFKALIAHVPFVDVVNTMLDETLPLTPGEFEEWGNPKDKDYFNYMMSYSPYDNVRTQVYPALYITGGLTDSRVTYWEPTKWLAKLRELNQGKAPVIMKMNMGAGHSGGSKRDEALKDDAEDLAFLLKVFGKI